MKYRDNSFGNETDNLPLKFDKNWQAEFDFNVESEEIKNVKNVHGSII